jgi:hypothetical protein
MATEAQVRANINNAQRSTGPRSDEGKAVSSHNAFRHGMRAASVLLPDEDPSALTDLHAELLRDLNPRGPMQRLLFDRIVAAAWRLRRAHVVECGIFGRSEYRYDASNNQSSLAQTLRLKFQNACFSADALGKLARYENSVERSLHRTLAELRRLQEAQGPQGPSGADGGDDAPAPAEKNLPNEPNSVVSDDSTGTCGAN